MAIKKKFQTKNLADEAIKILSEVKKQYKNPHALSHIKNAIQYIQIAQKKESEYNV